MVFGNWSTSSRGEFRVLYFVGLKEPGHFQSLLNGKFFDVFVTSNTSFRAQYDDITVSLTISDSTGKHPFAFGRISESLFVDLSFLSNRAISATFIDTSNRSISSWGFARPRPAPATPKDAIVVAAFVGCLLYLGVKAIDLIPRGP